MLSRLVVFIFCNCLITSALRAQLQFDLIEHQSGLTRPVGIDHAGDDRLFITEQNGAVRIIDEQGNLLPTPFLNLGLGNFSGGNEQGLLGLAFHPDYQNNGYLYINYTDENGDTRIDRYQVKNDNPNEVDPSSKSLVIKIDQPLSNHNGGDLNFGPDGYLYIGMGDGGGANDQLGNSQRRTSLHGKMLRIDVNVDSGYAIPADNPFAFDDFTLDEIWALGLRNPWRFSFDRLTGDMWIADVGQDDWEEVDFQAADSKGGENYGWNCFEGTAVFSTNDPCSVQLADYVAPVSQYESKSSTDGCSITGGYVYRGQDYPDLYGHYIYADYCSGKFWSISRDCDSNFVNQFLVQKNPFEISGFGEDQQGEVYVAALNEGKIYKVSATLCSGFELCAQTKDETCTEANDGQVIPLPKGGTAPYDYQTTVPNSFENLTQGEYSLQVRDANGCMDNITFNINTDELPTLPEIEIRDTTIDEQTFPVFVTTPNAFAYQWYLNDEQIEAATDSLYINMDILEGVFKVEVFINENCSSISKELPFAVPAVDDLSDLPLFRLSPNPFTTQLDYQLDFTASKEVLLNLIDVSGKKIWEQTLQGPFQKRETLSLSHLPKGVYYFSIEVEGRKVAKSLVKL